MKVDFCHLHLHTEYSMQDSLCRLEDLFQEVKEQGMQALAMTDHHSVSGAVDFYRLAHQNGVKPLLGCELRVGSILAESSAKSYHLTVLATNQLGFRNLLHLITYSNLENQGVVSRKMLEDWSQGLIFLSGCRESEVDEWIVQDCEQAKAIIQQYCQLFGKTNYYLELQRFGAPQEDNLIWQKVAIAREVGVSVVATNNVHYMERQEWDSFQTLQKLQTYYPAKSRNEFYLKSPEEMAQLFYDLPEAIENTVKIAARCDLKLDLDQMRLPVYESPPGINSATYLEQLCRQRVIERYGPKLPTEVWKRLTWELEVIHSLGYADYFLFIWDLVQVAKAGRFLLMGRGQVVSSLVSYLLEITMVDPLQQELDFVLTLDALFSWGPQLELMVDPAGAIPLIEYMRHKYGEERMAYLPKITTLSLPQTISKLASLKGWSKEELLSLSPLLYQQDFSTGRRPSPAHQPTWSGLFSASPQVDQLFHQAWQMVGLPWEYQLNQDQIVVAPESLAQFTALDFLGDNFVISQLNSAGINQLGLLQINLMENPFLAAVKQTFRGLQERGIELAYAQIPLDDPSIYYQLHKGRLKGCYLLGEVDCGQFLEQIRPTDFTGLTFVIALDQLEKQEPGLIQKLIEKAGEYAHPYLEELLDETYGVILYEEQLALLAHKLADFTLAEASTFSRVLQTKDLLQVAGQKSKFIRRAQGRQMTVMEATFLFDQIYHQVEYLLSKQDLIVEAQLAYITAYLKIHYRIDYLTSLLKVKSHI